MNRITKATLLLGATASLATSGFGQVVPTKLIGEGDAVAWSLDPVQSVLNVDVNNNGDWLVELDTGISVQPDDSVIVLNGALLYQEGSNLNFPASHTVAGNNWLAGGSSDAMDINDNGDILVELGFCTDANGILPGRSITMWTNGTSGITYALLEEGITPADSLIVPSGFGLEEPLGAVWASIDEIWQNNNNQLLVMGNTSTDADDLIVFMQHDGAGAILSQQLIASDGVRHDLAFGAPGTHVTAVETTYPTKTLQAINNLGEVIYPIDDISSAPGSSSTDGHLYKYDSTTNLHTELMWEADLSPTGTGSPYNQPSSFEVDINDSGTWVMSCDDDSSTLTDNFIQVTDAAGNISIFIQDSDPVPSLDPLLGFSVRTGTFGAVQISDAGDITWFCDWDDPDTTRDTGLFRNNILIWQEGVSVTALGEVARTIDTATDAMGVSDNGRYIIKELNVEPIGGDPSTTFDDLTSAYLFDLGLTLFTTLCNGDGGDQMGCTSCPCGNNASVGTIGGCLNSSLTSARLLPTGSASVSLPSGSSLDLRFALSDAPPLAFCILNSGDAVAPQGMANPCFGLNSGSQASAFDGLRCAVQNTRRHGGRSADASGDVGVTNNPWGGEAGPPAGLAVAGGGFASGQTRYFQVINRDDPLAVCGRGLNTSQAVEVTFQP